MNGQFTIFSQFHDNYTADCLILQAMKLLRHIITIVCIIAAPLANAGEKAADKTKEGAQESSKAATPIYETAEQIKAMPPCKATVEHTFPCYSLLRTADGKKFCIGSPGAKLEVLHFLDALKDGQIYKFPDVFLDYQKNSK